MTPLEKIEDNLNSLDVLLEHETADINDLMSYEFNLTGLVRALQEYDATVGGDITAPGWQRVREVLMGARLPKDRQVYGY